MKSELLWENLKIFTLRSCVTRKQATSKWLIKKVTILENMLKRMSKKCPECWFMFKLKDNFHKHPATMARGCKKVKILDEENKQTSLFTVEPFWGS